MKRIKGMRTIKRFDGREGLSMTLKEKAIKKLMEQCKMTEKEAISEFNERIRWYMRGGYTSVRYATECVIDEILYDDDTTVHPITEEYARMLDLMY